MTVVAVWLRSLTDKVFRISSSVSDSFLVLVSHFGTRKHLAAQKIKLVNDAVMAIRASPQCMRREINVEKSETGGSKDYSDIPD